ncbi:hypothetical protein QYF61_026128 [Mycteria americana]|uniref:Uncharacterized protein n=1 Tax=Mycteria americana TaxID=33587 RepID=A0AAN7NLY1_MYCAM|nr:hypothetical protein QYF61_026128 [Mycteria americana]
MGVREQVADPLSMSWFSPSRQLSTTQPLVHSPPVGWGREWEEQKRICSITFPRIDLVGPVSIGQGTRYNEEIFYDEGGETLEQVSQRGGKCPIPGNIQGQVGRGSEYPDLVEDVPAHCREVGLDDL